MVGGEEGEHGDGGGHEKRRDEGQSETTSPRSAQTVADGRVNRRRLRKKTGWENCQDEMIFQHWS